MTNRFFDYANRQNMIKMVKLFFENGHPYKPHLSAFFSDLNDLRTMRNASPHISSTTRTVLDSLALRIFGGVFWYNLVRLFIAVDSSSGINRIILVNYEDKLLVKAGLISQG